MFKSIFKRMLITYLIIIVSTIAVLSLVITEIFSWYFFNGKQTELENTAYKVNHLMNSYVKNEITKSELNNSLDSFGYITESKIYIVKAEKEALNNPQIIELGVGLEEDYLIKDMNKILSGETIFHKKKYSRNFGMNIVFTGTPWKSDNGIQGAILIFSPENIITKNIANINLIIWPTSLVFIVLSAIVIYFNSLRISRPIAEMEGAARKLASGEVTKDLVVSTEDEIGKLAETFNYMKHEIENTEKIRKELIANISHDLRTPLTSINGYVEGMIDGVIEPEDYNKSLNIIREETIRLSRLTSEILQLAKMQSGYIKLKKENINVLDTLVSVINSTKVLIDEKNLNLSIECGEAISIFADKDRLIQILINIIGNSIKYTESYGKISIKVREEKFKVEFSIKDTGIGIPVEDLPLIFEKFYRVDKSRQSNQGGTGLGLNISLVLIELHGGKIRAVSEKGEGTEITFEIPNY